MRLIYLRKGLKTSQERRSALKREEKMKKKKTLWITGVGFMAAVVILLANTPIGMIQLPVIKATTVHIPVIIGAILYGPLAGAILGGVFG